MPGVLPFTYINPYTGQKGDEAWVLISQERGGSNKGTWDMYSGGKEDKDKVFFANGEEDRARSLAKAAAREAAEESCEMIGIMDKIQEQMFPLNKSKASFLMEIKDITKVNNKEFLRRKKLSAYKRGRYQEKTEAKWVKMASLVDACVNKNGILKDGKRELVIRPWFAKSIARNRSYFNKNFLGNHQVHQNNPHHHKFTRETQATATFKVPTLKPNEIHYGDNKLLKGSKDIPVASTSKAPLSKELLVIPVFNCPLIVLARLF